MSRPRRKSPQFTEQELASSLLLLGSSIQEFRAPPTMQFEDGVRAVEEMKSRVRKRWKQLQFEVHPDRGGDEEKFKLLSNVVEFIGDLELERGPVQPPVRRVVVRQGFVNVSNTTGSAATTGFGGGGAPTVTIIFGGRGF